MKCSTCENCGQDYYWRWEEAFEKFGFNDGDGQIETWSVVSILEEHGYIVETTEWGLHNTVISSLKKDDREFIPDEDSGFQFGYDDPRRYLPDEIILLLDQAF